MTYVIIECLAQLLIIIYTVIAAIIRISTKAMPVKCHPKKIGVHSQFSTNCIIKNTNLAPADREVTLLTHPLLIKDGQENTPDIDEQDIPEEVKVNLIKARKGQGKYRENLLAQCPFCPITLVSDDRLLIASHIKPWVKSNDDEKIDPKNGFMLTPTYDFLFDRGYISFTNDKKIIISPWLSKMTCSKLNISNDKTYSLLPTEGRENYLDYHRNEVLKK